MMSLSEETFNEFVKQEKELKEEIRRLHAEIFKKQDEISDLMHRIKYGD